MWQARPASKRLGACCSRVHRRTKRSPLCSFTRSRGQIHPLRCHRRHRYRFKAAPTHFARFGRGHHQHDHVLPGGAHRMRQALQAHVCRCTRSGVCIRFDDLSEPESQSVRCSLVQMSESDYLAFRLVLACVLFCVSLYTVSLRVRDGNHNSL